MNPLAFVDEVALFSDLADQLARALKASIPPATGDGGRGNVTDEEVARRRARNRAARIARRKARR